jgi:hypothetical protein
MVTQEARVQVVRVDASSGRLEDEFEAAHGGYVYMIDGDAEANLERLQTGDAALRAGRPTGGPHDTPRVRAPDPQLCPSRSSVLGVQPRCRSPLTPTAAGPQEALYGWVRTELPTGPTECTSFAMAEVHRRGVTART